MVRDSLMSSGGGSPGSILPEGTGPPVIGSMRGMPVIGSSAISGVSGQTASSGVMLMSASRLLTRAMKVHWLRRMWFVPTASSASSIMQSLLTYRRSLSNARYHFSSGAGMFVSCP